MYSWSMRIRHACGGAHGIQLTQAIGGRSGAHGLAQKLYNWSTLNQRVFRRLGFVVAKAECEAVALCEPGAVERVLKLVRVHIADHAERQRQQVSEPAVPAHGAASQARPAFQSNALLRHWSAIFAGTQA